MLVNIGHEHFIERGLVVAVLPPGSAPAKRLKETAAKSGRLIDATAGRQTRCLVLLEVQPKELLVTSSLQTETMRARLDAHLNRSANG